MDDSVRLALWFAAWLRGAVSLDDARDAIVADDAAHDVVGLPGHDAPTPLIIALGVLRGLGVEHTGVALPVPGDPLGLAGPPPFNAESLEVGEAVLLPGTGLGLVPVRAGAGVVWRCLPAEGRRQVPDPSEADTALRAALPATADVLADLDVARWRPEVADELISLRRESGLDLPPGVGARTARMLGLAARCRRIVDLALVDDGGSVTAYEADARRAALDPLDRAARRAVVAAVEHPWDR